MILWIVFCLMYEKNEYICLSHFAWREMTALMTLVAYPQGVSTYIPPMPGAGSFGYSSDHVLVYKFPYVWATPTFCLALAPQAHCRYLNSLLYPISQTQSLWPRCCTPWGSVIDHEFSQQLQQEHLNMTEKGLRCFAMVLIERIQFICRESSATCDPNTESKLCEDSSIQHSQHRKSPSGLSSAISATSAVTGILPEIVAVSGILLLNTLLTFFNCNTQKVPLNEKICLPVFYEPCHVYRVLSNLTLLPTLLSSN